MTRLHGDDGERNDQDPQVGDASAEHGGKRKREDERGYRQHDVEERDDDGVDSPAVIPADQPEQPADHDAERDRAEAHDQRVTGAVDGAREQVVAVAVTTEQVTFCRKVMDEAEWTDGKVTAGPQSGSVKIEINQTYPLEAAAKAHADLAARKTTGSTVLLV